MLCPPRGESAVPPRGNAYGPPPAPPYGGCGGGWSTGQEKAFKRVAYMEKCCEQKRPGAKPVR